MRHVMTKALSTFSPYKPADRDENSNYTIESWAHRHIGITTVIQGSSKVTDRS
jgi:hypothetical protein